jgi:hypothetical protein
MDTALPNGLFGTDEYAGVEMKSSIIHDITAFGV